MGDESSRTGVEVPSPSITRRGFLLAFAAGTAVACGSAGGSPEAVHDAGLDAAEPEASSVVDSGTEAGEDAGGNPPVPDGPALRRQRQRREATEWELRGWPGAESPAFACSDEFLAGTCARNTAGLFAHTYG